MPVVQIEKPESEPLAAWFEALRTWLDGNGCQGVSFTRAGRRPDRLMYRLTFDDAARAEKFAAAFAEYVPAARQPSAGDPSDFLDLGTVGEVPA